MLDWLSPTRRPRATKIKNISLYVSKKSSDRTKFGNIRHGLIISSLVEAKFVLYAVYDLKCCCIIN